VELGNDEPAERAGRDREESNAEDELFVGFCRRHPFSVQRALSGLNARRVKKKAHEWRGAARHR
jgi:hypothetical protein